MKITIRQENDRFAIYKQVSESAGEELVDVCEKLDDAKTVIAERFPGATISEDVRETPEPNPSAIPAAGVADQKDSGKVKDNAGDKVSLTPAGTKYRGEMDLKPTDKGGDGDNPEGEDEAGKETYPAIRDKGEKVRGEMSSSGKKNEAKDEDCDDEMVKEDDDNTDDVDESLIKKLLDTMGLNEAAGEEVRTIFETAVAARTVKARAKLNEEFAAKEKSLVENIDRYADYVVNQFISTNESSIKLAVRNELLESAVADITAVLTKYNVDVAKQVSEATKVEDTEVKALREEHELAVTTVAELRAKLFEKEKKEIF
jgi:hypothetical protein